MTDASVIPFLRACAMNLTPWWTGAAVVAVIAVFLVDPDGPDGDEAPRAPAAAAEPAPAAPVAVLGYPAPALNPFVADVDGRWAGEVNLGGGSVVHFGFELRADAGRVTGSATFPVGTSRIEDGRLEADRISFSTRHVLAATGAPLVTRFSGVVAGDAIAFDMLADGAVTPIAARRVAR